MSNATIDILSLRGLESFTAEAVGWLQSDLLTWSSALQATAVLSVLVLGWFLGVWPRRLVRRRFGLGRAGKARDLAGSESLLRNMAATAVGLIPQACILFLLMLVLVGLRSFEQPHKIAQVSLSLMAAWVFIKLMAGMVRDRFWSKVISTTAWSLAALNILGLLHPALAFLEGAGLDLGKTHVSVLSLLKAALLFLILLKLGNLLSAMVVRQLDQSETMTPSMRVLMGKGVRLAFIILAGVAALSSAGVNLAALAVFGGAVGVGLGFGLQKVVSNLVSGVILLLDKSIKPGDIIEVGGVYGWIQTLGARYTSVVTRDGTEYLIPNEDLITSQVVNWSFSNRNVRRKLPVGVSYDADVKLAMKLIVEAGRETKRVLPKPAPVCRMIGFGDSSVDLELRFWIEDPENGVANVASDILERVWEKFHEHGIEIPFPQRDLHIRSGLPEGWGAREPAPETVPETAPHPDEAKADQT